MDGSTVAPRSFTVLARVVVQTVIAVLSVLSVLPCAHASVESTKADPSGAQPSDPAIVQVVLTDTASSPTTDGEPDAGGAIFSPFAMAPAMSAPRPAQESGPLPIDEADLTFAAIAALLGIRAFAYVVHRAKQ